MGNEASHQQQCAKADTGFPKDDSKSAWMPSGSTVLCNGYSSAEQYLSESESVMLGVRGSRLKDHSTGNDTDTETMTELTFSKAPTKKPKSRHRRQSSLEKVKNGVVGVVISAKICAIAAKFWHANITNLSVADRLEIGCSIFFSMMANDDMKTVMKANFRQKRKIEATSMKYLDMMGWLMRNLVADGIDLYALLSKLGVVHQAMGVSLKHFDPMLQAMHETFAYYFDTKYTIEIKYAFDEIFSVAAQIMTGQELGSSSRLNQINQQFQDNAIPFLKGIDVCLQSNIGQEYLYRFLQQTWCDEMVIFLKALARFKSSPSNGERFMVARQITKTCIEASGSFSLNISYEQRMASLNAMEALEKKFAAKLALDIPVTLFENVETEIYKLINENHWNKFKDSIRSLQQKSSSVE
eukprot:CAMPEP_0197038180 /NCGR_PEP_ID=MMETSP1384-20130603/15163_1 /TAXON_ID=29189 /ORGANISM="Ammonia sp." /LENGTH=410 /DNA_ID=CAMNT_0042468577 /DNA_START=24 /DNA_END=1256 /DNA_ORIENTATION=+